MNQSQLQNFAQAAAAELEAHLPGGAGDGVAALVAHWSPAPEGSDDFLAANLGQVKMVPRPFIIRLLQAGSNQLLQILQVMVMPVPDPIPVKVFRVASTQNPRVTVVGPVPTVQQMEDEFNARFAQSCLRFHVVLMRSGAEGAPGRWLRHEDWLAAWKNAQKNFGRQFP